MHLSSRELSGISLAIVSATAFGATAIIAKFAYREGVDVTTLLVTRFSLGAAMLWGLVFAMRIPRALTRSQVLVFLALGAVGYATQSRLVFESLKRIPAGTAILVLYAYPAIVAIIAVALRRERLGLSKGAALALGLGGVTLVLGAPAPGTNVVGVVLALGGALGYAIYITIVQRAAEGVHPLLSSAVIVSGAAASFVVTGSALGEINFDVSAAGWTWLVLLAFASITIAVSTLLAAVERIGPTRASIVSTWEPVVTVLLAGIAIGERLRALQLIGGLLVVAAVAVLPLTSRAPVVEGESPVVPEATQEGRNSSGKSRVT